MKEPPACVFCGTGKGTTADHVPPRAFFPEKLPQGTEMLTAPCCVTCHALSQKDDPTLRNLVISLADTEDHPLISNHLAGKRDRSFDYRPSEILRLMNLMTNKELLTPAGIYIGEAPAFDLGRPIVQRFVERMARGLLWRAFSMPYFDGRFPYCLNPEHIDYSGFQKFGVIRGILDVFAYGALQGKGNQPHWVVFQFYGNLEFLVRVIDDSNRFEFKTRK